MPARDPEASEAFAISSTACRSARCWTTEVRRDGGGDREGAVTRCRRMSRQIAPQSAAYATGMRPGDVIVAVDGAPIVAFSQLKEVVESSGGRVLKLEVWRDGEMPGFALAPRRVDEPQPEGGFETHWRIGIAGGLAFEPATERLGPLAALGWRGAGVAGDHELAVGALPHDHRRDQQLQHVRPHRHRRGVGRHGQPGLRQLHLVHRGAVHGRGLLNLFPIPVLDGGHLVFHAYEAVAGRPPSDAALRALMTWGWSSCWADGLRPDQRHLLPLSGRAPRNCHFSGPIPAPHCRQLCPSKGERGNAMQQIVNGYRGLGILVDRQLGPLILSATIVLALLAGASSARSDPRRRTWRQSLQPLRDAASPGAVPLKTVGRL